MIISGTSSALHTIQEAQIGSQDEAGTIEANSVCCVPMTTVQLGPINMFACA